MKVLLAFDLKFFISKVLTSSILPVYEPAVNTIKPKSYLKRVLNYVLDRRCSTFENICFLQLIHILVCPNLNNGLLHISSCIIVTKT